MIVVEENTGIYELPNLNLKPRRFGLSDTNEAVQEIAVLDDLRLKHAYVISGNSFHNNATLWVEHDNNYGNVR